MVTNRLDEALAHCTAAAELDPSFPPVWINLGNIHLLKEDYETARTCFAKAISLDKDVAPAYFGLGSIEQCTGGDPGRVRELYRKAVDISPFNPQFHHALGNLLAGEGNPEAMEHFTAAEQLFNTLKDLQRDFGQACLQFGRREEGLEHLRVAVEQNPEDELARELLAKADAADQ
jgi:tetratricopeptide (TPR) repeat protein